MRGPSSVEVGHQTIAVSLAYTLSNLLVFFLHTTMATIGGAASSSAAQDGGTDTSLSGGSPSPSVLVVLTLCDPPPVSDFREALEVARPSFTHLAVMPLGTEYSSAWFSTMSRHVMCHLTLGHCAPAAFAMGASGCSPCLLAPQPAYAEQTT